MSRYYVVREPTNNGNAGTCWVLAAVVILILAWILLSTHQHNKTLVAGQQSPGIYANPLSSPFGTPTSFPQRGSGINVEQLPIGNPIHGSLEAVCAALRPWRPSAAGGRFLATVGIPGLLNQVATFPNLDADLRRKLVTFLADQASSFAQATTNEAFEALAWTFRYQFVSQFCAAPLPAGPGIPGPALRLQLTPSGGGRQGTTVIPGAPPLPF